MFRPLTWMSAGILLAQSGCVRVDYPEVAVQSSVGRPGICAHCGKRLADVQDDNLIEVDHIQFIVCDHDCAAGIMRWMVEQGER